MIYLTSDTHFSHKKIIEYCNRPFENAHIMDRTIIENWNSVVKDGDLVYHLGDFAFAPIKNYIRYLNGEIILIRGNHDRGSYIKNSGLKVYQNYDIEYAGLKLKLIHKPIFIPENDDESLNTDGISNDVDIDNYDWIICGHVHEKWKRFQKNFNVGVDVWDFTPVSMETLVKELRR